MAVLYIMSHIDELTIFLNAWLGDNNCLKWHVKQFNTSKDVNSNWSLISKHNLVCLVLSVGVEKRNYKEVFKINYIDYTPCTNTITSDKVTSSQVWSLLAHQKHVPRFNAKSIVVEITFLAITHIHYRMP